MFVAVSREKTFVRRRAPELDMGKQQPTRITIERMADMGKIGFIGLGIMGKPMSRNLLKGGADLLVYDIDAAAVETLVKEGAVSASLSEIGEACDMVFTILPKGEIVREVLFCENGVAAGMSKGGVVVDMSSVTPTDSKECAKRLSEKGIGFIDAPVSGGEPKAIDGTLAIMAGGNQADFERALPLFKLMGSSAALVGTTGSGSTAKLVNQVIVNGTIALVAEAFVFCVKSGAAPMVVYEAIRGGLAGSTILDAKLPMMASRDFNPGGKISINHKDIGNVLKTAHIVDCPMPFTAQLYEIMQTLKVAGQMDDDHSALVNYFERLAGVLVEDVGEN